MPLRLPRIYIEIAPNLPHFRMRILSDAQYVPQATPVYSHPLLRTAKASASREAPTASDDPLTSDLHAAPTSDNGHVDVGGGVAPEFLDPLGAFASTVDATVARKDASANGTSAKGAGEQPTTFADPLVAGRLGNTLRCVRRNLCFYAWPSRTDNSLAEPQADVCPST